MSEVIINLPEIALLETSREVGYLAGYYGVKPEELDDNIKGSNIGDWYKSLIDVVISNANDELKLFKNINT